MLLSMFGTSRTCGFSWVALGCRMVSRNSAQLRFGLSHFHGQPWVQQCPIHSHTVLGISDLALGGLAHFLLMGCTAQKFMNTQLAAYIQTETHFTHQFAKRSTQRSGGLQTKKN
jgi:hypothetical protein